MTKNWLHRNWLYLLLAAFLLLLAITQSQPRNNSSIESQAKTIKDNSFREIYHITKDTRPIAQSLKQTTPTPHHKYFYVGASLGVDNLNGFQNDTIDFGPAGRRNINIYSNRIFQDSNLVSTFFVGAEYPIGNTHISIGCEPYACTSSLIDKAMQTNIDSMGSGISADFVSLELEMKQSWRFGIPIKLSFSSQETWQFYGITGIEFARIRHRTELSSEAQSFNSTQNTQLHLKGLILGGGVTYIANRVHAGIEIKNVRYHEKNISQNFDTSIIATNTVSIKPSIMSITIKIIYYI